MARFLIRQAAGEADSGGNSTEEGILDRSQGLTFWLPSRYKRAFVSQTGFAMFAAALTIIGCSSGGYQRARYSHFTYTWHPGSEVLFTFQGRDASYNSEAGIAGIYVRLGKGAILFLPEITLEEAAQNFRSAGWRESVSAVWPDSVSYSDGHSRVQFENQIIDSVLLDSDSQVCIALTRNGPFVSMPKTTEELVSLFGEPIDWAPYHPPRSP